MTYEQMMTAIALVMKRNGTWSEYLTESSLIEEVLYSLEMTWTEWNDQSVTENGRKAIVNSFTQGYERWLGHCLEEHMDYVSIYGEI